MTIQDVVEQIDEQIEQLTDSRNELLTSGINKPDSVLLLIRYDAIRTDLGDLQYPLWIGSEDKFQERVADLRTVINSRLQVRRRKFNSRRSKANRYWLKTEFRRRHYLCWVVNMLADTKSDGPPSAVKPDYNRLLIK